MKRKTKQVDVIKPAKPKPQLIINAVGAKKKVSIIVSGGCVVDVVKSSCPDVNIEIYDYDVEGDDCENCFLDNEGKQYKLITIE